MRQHDLPDVDACGKAKSRLSNLLPSHVLAKRLEVQYSTDLATCPTAPVLCGALPASACPEGPQSGRCRVCSAHGHQDLCWKLKELKGERSDSLPRVHSTSSARHVASLTGAAASHFHIHPSTVPRLQSC